MAEALGPLTAVLAELDGAALGLALRAAALHLVKRDDEIDVAAVIEGLEACGVTGSPKKLLGACGSLLKQAGKGGGQTQEKLDVALRPLGFSSEHLTVLVDTLGWVKAGAVVGEEPAPPPPLKPKKKKKKSKKVPSLAVAEPEPARDLTSPPPIAEGGAPEPDDIKKFHWAAITGSTAELEGILAAATRQLMDSQDNRGYSAYHHACANGHAAAVQALVHAGCNTQLANDFHLTGWRLAISLRKDDVLTTLSEIGSRAHPDLAGEKVAIERDEKQQRERDAAASLEFWNVKIGYADEAQQSNKAAPYTVYVVEVWGESKRLAISHRRYNEFYKFRGDLLAELTSEGMGDEAGKMERLPFPQKTDIKVMIMGKNSETVKTQRIVELSAWLNAALAILGKRPQLCKFLGISAEYIGVTIVAFKEASQYEAHGHLYEVTPSVRPSARAAGVVAKGLSTIDLPRKCLYGCDDTGVQLFHATGDREAIDGEGYPYHIIHSWSRYEPQGGKPSIALEFGQDQGKFELHFETEKGQDICSAMRQYATELATKLRRGGFEAHPTSDLEKRKDSLLARKAAQQKRNDPQITHTIADLAAIQLVRWSRLALQIRSTRRSILRDLHNSPLWSSDLGLRFELV